MSKEDMVADPAIIASGIVYLYGEQFVEPAKVAGETLVVSGVKVKARELAEMLFGLGLLGLQAQGAIKVELAQRKKLLGIKVQTAAVTVLNRPAVGGLEGVILQNLNADQAKNDVAEVIGRIIPQPVSDPWGNVTKMVRSHLTANGYLSEEREARAGLAKLLGDKVTLHPVNERITPLAGEAARLKSLLADWQAREPLLAQQLWKDMRSGFTKREEKPDMDTD